MDSDFERRQREAFDIAAIGEAYAAQGSLTHDEFSKCFDQTVGVRALQLPDLNWTVFDHIISTHREIDILKHYAALSAGLRRPFTTIQEFYANLIERRLVPRYMLNHTQLYGPKPKSKLLGEIAIEVGLMAPNNLRRSIEYRDAIVSKVGVTPAIGQILVWVGPLSVIDLFQLLALQHGIEFRSLDESAPLIFAKAVRS